MASLNNLDFGSSLQPCTPQPDDFEPQSQRRSWQVYVEQQSQPQGPRSDDSVTEPDSQAIEVWINGQCLSMPRPSRVVTHSVSSVEASLEECPQPTVSLFLFRLHVSHKFIC